MNGMTSVLGHGVGVLHTGGGHWVDRIGVIQI